MHRISVGYVCVLKVARPKSGEIQLSLFQARSFARSGRRKAFETEKTLFILKWVSRSPSDNEVKEEFYHSLGLVFAGPEGGRGEGGTPGPGPSPKAEAKKGQEFKSQALQLMLINVVSRADLVERGGYNVYTFFFFFFAA